jgi:DHA1 family tetracycline resistance protein-like MFS transporter
VFVLYAGYRFHWSPGTTGLFMAGVSIVGVFVQSVAVGPFVRRFGERACLIVGATMPIIGLGWIAFAPNAWFYLIGVPFNAFWQLLIPGLQGLMTRRVGPTEQGQLQGANQSLIGMASVVGPLVYGLSFAQTVRHPEWHLPGLPFLLASLTMAVCLGIAILAGRSARAHASREAAE